MPWFSVRSVYRYVGRLDGRDAYEERVVMFDSPTAEDAIARAEAEAADYVSGQDDQTVLELFQSFRLFDHPADGAEVFSLVRASDLSPEEYLDHFFGTGTERQSGLESRPRES